MSYSLRFGRSQHCANYYGEQQQQQPTESVFDDALSFSGPRATPGSSEPSGIIAEAFPPDSAGGSSSSAACMAPLATPDSHAGSTTAGTLPAAAACHPRAGELA